MAVQAAAPQLVGLGGIHHPLIGPSVLVGGALAATTTYLITTRVDGQEGAKEDNEYSDLGYAGLFGVLGAAATYAVLQYAGQPSRAYALEPTKEEVQGYQWDQTSDGFWTMRDKSDKHVEVPFIDPLDKEALTARCEWLARVVQLDYRIHKIVLTLKRNGVCRRWRNGQHSLMIADNSDMEVSGVLNGVCGTYITPVEWGTTKALEYLYGPMCPLSPQLAEKISAAIGAARPDSEESWAQMSRGLQYFLVNACLVWAPKVEQQFFKLSYVAGANDMALARIAQRPVAHYAPGEFERYQYIVHGASDKHAYWGLSKGNKEYLREHWGVKPPEPDILELTNDNGQLNSALKTFMERLQLVQVRMQPRVNGEVPELTEAMEATGLTNTRGMEQVVDSDSEAALVTFAQTNLEPIRTVGKAIGFIVRVYNLQPLADEAEDDTKCFNMTIRRFNIAVFELYNLLVNNAKALGKDDGHADARAKIGKYLPRDCATRNGLSHKLHDRYENGGPSHVVADPGLSEGLSVPQQIRPEPGGAAADITSFGIKFTVPYKFATDVLIRCPGVTYTTFFEWKRPKDVLLFDRAIFTELMPNDPIDNYSASARQYTQSWRLEDTWFDRMRQFAYSEPYKDLATLAAKACKTALDVLFEVDSPQQFEPTRNVSSGNPSDRIEVIVGNVGPALATPLRKAIASAMERHLGAV